MDSACRGSCTIILPEPIRTASALYVVGCVAGTLPRDENLRLIAEAGVEAIEVAGTKSIDLPDDMLALHLDAAALPVLRSSGTTLHSALLCPLRNLPEPLPRSLTDAERNLHVSAPERPETSQLATNAPAVPGNL